MDINKSLTNIADLAKDFTSINEGKPLLSDNNLTSFFSELLSKFDLPNLLSDQEINLDNLSAQNSDLLLDSLENSSSTELTSISALYLSELQSLNESSEQIQKADESYSFLGSDSIIPLSDQDLEIAEEELFDNSNAQDITFNNSESLSLPIEQSLNSNLSSDQSFRQTSDLATLLKEEMPVKSENDISSLEEPSAQENETSSINQSSQEVEISDAEPSNIESNFEHIIKLLDKNDFKYSSLSATQSASKYQTLENMYNQENLVLDQLKVHLNKLSPEANKIKVQLHPEELGSIEMEINFNDQVIKDLIIKVEKVDTYNLLQKDASELKSILSELGFELSESTFSFNLENNQNQQNQHQNPKRRLYESIDITNKLVENFLNIDEIGRIDITI